MAASSKKEETDLLDLLKTLAKNLPIMISCLLIASIIGVFISLWIRPTFQVDALLQIESKNSKNPSNMMSGLSSLFETTSPAETEIELIKSRQIIGDAVEKMHLQYKAIPQNKLDRLLHKEGRMDIILFEIPWEKFPIEERFKSWTAIATDSLSYDLYDHEKKKVLSGKSGTTYRFPYAGDTATFSVYSMQAKAGQRFQIFKLTRLAAIDEFKKAFSVNEKGRKTGVLEFSYQNRYSDKATEVLNEIATSYLRQNVESRNAEAQKTLEFLEKQLPIIKTKMDSALFKYNTYRNQIGSVDIFAETRIVLEKRNKLQQEILNIQQKKQEAIRLFHAEHPTVKTLEEQETNLKKELTNNINEAKRLPSTQQEVLKLSNDVELNKTMYTAMLNNIQQLKLVSAGEVGSVRIIDFAEEVYTPAKPKRPVIIAIALFFGFLFGTFIVVIKETLGGGIRDARILERETGYSVYAKIPKGNPNGTKGTCPLAIVEPDDVAIEAIRSLRSSLEFSMEENIRPIIGISGLIPGVGKSFVSVNLAALCANAGKRVLLIDADLRKGRLHKEFGLKRGDGLSQALLHTVEVQNIISKTKVENLYLIPSGKVPANPAELLSSKHYDELIENLEKNFDLIIIDTPPIMLVTDAALACRQASQIVMVIEYNKHSLEAIQEGMKQLLKGNSKAHASFVINKYEHRHAEGYGYKYGKY